MRSSSFFSIKWILLLVFGFIFFNAFNLLNKTSFVQLTTKKFGWRGQADFVAKDVYSVSAKKEKKWEELKPFFDKFLEEFKDLLLVQIYIDKGSSKPKMYFVNALFENIAEKDLNKWTTEARKQLHFLMLSEVTFDDLNKALENAKNNVKNKKDEYLNVFRNRDRKAITKKIAESSLPYLTANDFHFPITNINKEIQNPLPDKSELDKEITILLLAKLTIKELTNAFQALSQSENMWKDIQPDLEGFQKKQYLLFSYEKGLLAWVWALFDEKNKKEYYELSGAAKNQLWYLIRQGFDDAKQLIDQLRLNSLASTSEQTNQENTESVLSEINFVLDDISKLKPNLKKINLDGEEYDVQTQPNTNTKILVKNKIIQNSQVVLNKLKKYLSDIKESPKNQNLAIGLGTAGGIVALAGVGGFAYWFLKIRKS